MAYNEMKKNNPHDKRLGMMHEAHTFGPDDGPMENNPLESGLSSRSKLGRDIGGVVKSNILVDKEYPEESTNQDQGKVF